MKSVSEHLPLRAEPLIARLGLLALLAATRLAAAAPPSTADIAEAAQAGYVYGLPYVEMARTRAASLTRGLPVDVFFHRRALSGPADRWVTTPNNDTLYSSAWLDLANGPVLLSLPDFGQRYWSMALMSMTTDNFAVIGRNLPPGPGGKVLIAGPNAGAIEANGALLVRSPTRWVWALGRILVDGPADLPAVYKLQDAMRLTPTGRPPSSPVLPAPPKPDDGADFFRQLAEILAENPPPEADRPMLDRLAGIGLVPGKAFDAGDWSESQRAALQQGFLDGRDAVKGRGGLQLGQVVDGWSYPPAAIGVFGTDYGLRALVALGGLAALPPSEAVYLTHVAPADGSKNWRLTFPPGRWPPAGAFWSLSMYERTPEGRLFFTANSIDRYAIGDRTAGLKPNPDGSLQLLIGTQAPAGREGNWLPAPSGPFVITLRVYLPTPALAQGWRVPALKAE